MHHNLADCGSFVDAVGRLCSPFWDVLEMFNTCTVVGAEDLPDPFAALLVHEQHMTATLNAHFRTNVELEILEHSLQGDRYSREILLRVPPRGLTVEYGLMRMDLSLIPIAAREAVLGGKVPLGDILVQSDVLRRISPQWYFRVEPTSPLVERWEGRLSEPVFGRVGTIDCDHTSAIEVLEVVTSTISS